MKKFIYVLIALLTFACSVFVFYIHPLIFPISLAELRQNASNYKSRKFKVVGKLEVWEAESVKSINLKDWENGCSREPFCFRGLELSEDIKAENSLLLNELAEKNKTIGKTDLRHGEYYVEVEITGRLVEKENEYFGGIYYDINVDELKPISPIKFVFVEEFYPK